MHFAHARTLLALVPGIAGSQPAAGYGARRSRGHLCLTASALRGAPHVAFASAPARRGAWIYETRASNRANCLFHQCRCVFLARATRGRHATSISFMRPNEEDGELRAVAAGWADHVERLRVAGSHRVLEAPPHVRHLAVGPVHVRPSREHAAAHGHGPQRLEHGDVLVGGLPPHRVPHALAVAEHGPHGLLQHPPVVVVVALEAGAAHAGGTGGGVGGVAAIRVLLALQHDARARVGTELAEQRVRRERELHDQRGAAPRVVLQGQRDAAVAVAEERAGEAVPGRRRAGGRTHELRQQGVRRGEPRRRRDPARTGLQLPPAPRVQQRERPAHALEHPHRPGTAGRRTPPRRLLERVPRGARRGRRQRLALDGLVVVVSWSIPSEDMDAGRVLRSGSSAAPASTTSAITEGDELGPRYRCCARRPARPAAPPDRPPASAMDSLRLWICAARRRRHGGVLSWDRRLRLRFGMAG
ncbi:LOW QUALITY PROTEIN: hypothetical protein SETIT_7G256500v2 [Setaria italica]|uniref:Uncharacterized protein n=1 Tax=Setaria italica TaxID=4555 RepID=A0A368RZP0_SETIT|nr:LOW QUALITY PROTEIN: hypothetical protein SETIT_7G256500v2 [Setaria italica]